MDCMGEQEETTEQKTFFIQFSANLEFGTAVLCAVPVVAGRVRYVHPRAGRPSEGGRGAVAEPLDGPGAVAAGGGAGLVQGPPVGPAAVDGARWNRWSECWR